MCHRTARVRAGSILALFALLAAVPQAQAEEAASDRAWTLPQRHRLVLAVDPRGRKRSNSPALVEVDFQRALAGPDGRGSFDETTVEVVALREGTPAQRVPHRVERLFGGTKATLHFVMPTETHTNFAVYFDTTESRLGQPRRYPGLVGDGDFFRTGFARREIAPTHFDAFADLDGDGDLDLFKGGVEPFVCCFENVGGNRLIERGRLASGGEVFKLPCSRANRSWVTVAFHDADGDGDHDFFPSFGDGPDAGKVIFYRNTTRVHGGQLAFTRVGPLATASGTPLAGGAQAGGWFPSITFADWDGDGVDDALVGSANRCWFYRGRGTSADGAPRFDDAVAVQAGGQDIMLTNPRFAVADIDADGDLDLFAGTQPGPVHLFRNTGSRAQPRLAAGEVVAWSGNYLIGDAHSGAAIADFDGDGRLDLASGRFWERADLHAPAAPRDFGGFFKNVGARASPRFAKRTRGSPFTDQFQICDAVRQNSVRAVDWDHDGAPDLLAGDTDGFLWFFRCTEPRSRRREEAQIVSAERGQSLLTSAATVGEWATFAPGEKLRVGETLLSLAASGGHARFDVCDWNNDGRRDLVVADGQGTVTLFLNQGGPAKPRLAAGSPVLADGKPIQAGPRASVLVCDWDNDGRKDLVLAGDRHYSWHRNIGTDAAPRLAAAQPITFGGKPVAYVRPNLGSFVDWDGDGRRDLIGCHFENSIRFYRNLGSGAPGEEPRFADPEGVVILQGESPQMISGADAVDWNGDGDLDLLTGQGHGGSGLRFYERDWIEDELRGTHPAVSIRKAEKKPGRP
jgi:hypothetical protein